MVLSTFFLGQKMLLQTLLPPPILLTRPASALLAGLVPTSWVSDTRQASTVCIDLMMISLLAVSPWQFKELGGELDWVEQSDELWKYRWEQAISDVKPDIVEIVTWNDYGLWLFLVCSDYLLIFFYR